MPHVSLFPTFCRFISCLNNAEKNNTLFPPEVAEKLRLTVEGQLFRVERIDIRTTLSIGVSILPPEGKELLNCVKRAETALHKAKRSGRNQVVLFKPSMVDGDIP
ncbi:MAG: diguanylate cyclase [Desulfocapsa sp.]|nr:diguanylate cyclase [Desulfocapsa sp.]